MDSAKKVLKVASGIFLVVTLLGQSTEAFAWGRDDRRDDRRHDFYYTPHYAPHGREFRSLPYGYMRLILGGLEYFYWEGMFYRMNADRYIVVQAPVGAVVTAIPTGSQPVIVDGVAYYNINGITYMYTPSGYQVVPQPKSITIKNYAAEQSIAAPAQPAANTQVQPSNVSEESFTVNIPNSKGTYSAVTLKRSGSGFLGPQGEYYTEFPRIDQLKVMYGK